MSIPDIFRIFGTHGNPIVITNHLNLFAGLQLDHAAVEHLTKGTMVLIKKFNPSAVKGIFTQTLMSVFKLIIII